ncbi:imidazolonepropionase [Dermatophilus congolensis]|uniref:Imidazolonepropionase n=1 Tax=Dermatophilus congolensis TaxID=1863 RepID=A0A239VIP8_9MICO|nr:imidazolonepropionase [Dermatophilus congolensis]MBO3129094.1 imidazolonepropionase [Dermatophilus congolensis]MBO3132269.1 imidazolonepropionase [Dermatophilus congolensis]MBO3133570.1 imidazolonepropionase [Dermatophilus congolensis]MBO3135803.1 imidazolonepropionase [Dermatophilus congolensis]MBO3138045.1 imidazolonepropionase [Dermatophilus congolensis]
MSELITGITELLTNNPDRPRITDAAIVIDGERIAWVGHANAAPATDSRTDVAGRAVLPGWVDSHSHLVFAGDRSAEFEARMAGEPYAAGGIGVTTAATRAASDEELTRLVTQRIAEAHAGGTTYLETKTGYGLDVEQEARAARIAANAVDEVTYLGAHLIPPGPDGHPMDADTYIDLVTGPMLHAVRPYVQWADVFCEEGAFTVEQSRHILTACKNAGLGLRVHGNQIGHSGGVALAVEMGAASVDHCNHLDDNDINALAATETVATALPACDLSTRAPLVPARRLLDAGVTMAIATNCNPGTSYTSSMNFCVGIAVLQMGMTILEAVRAATWGGARALRRETGTDTRPAIGSIIPGARADLHVLDAPAAIHLAYRPGMPLTWGVWRAGARVHSNR